MVKQTQTNIAFALASQYHAGQRYGNEEYMVHLLEVHDMVVKMYNDKDKNTFFVVPGSHIDILRAASILHDIIEDTDATYTILIEAGICEDVADAVVCLTKLEGQSYDEYIAKVKSNGVALKVKLCDSARNLRHSIDACNKYRICKYANQIRLLGGFK